MQNESISKKSSFSLIKTRNERLRPQNSLTGIEIYMKVAVIYVEYDILFCCCFWLQNEPRGLIMSLHPFVVLREGCNWIMGFIQNKLLVTHRSQNLYWGQAGLMFYNTSVQRLVKLCKLHLSHLKTQGC